MPDASGGDAASEPDAPDAGSSALGPEAIVFAAALEGQAEADLYVLDRTSVTRLTTTAGAELYPAISPDRTTIAFVRDFQLFAIDANGRTERVIAPNTGRQRFGTNGQVSSTTLGPAAWSPDGTQLAYPYPRDPYYIEVDPGVFLDENGATTVHIINADGTGDHVVPNLGDGPAATLNSIGWGPGDVLSLQFADDCPDCAGGSWFAVIKTDGTGYRELRFGDYIETGRIAPNKHLDWSPDGLRWVYVANGGYWDYEQPGTISWSPAYVDDEHPVTLTYDTWNPRWSPDGTEIAYIGADGIYVVEAAGGTARRALVVTGVHGLDW